MRVVSEGFETLTSHRRRKSVWRRNVPAVGVDCVVERFGISFRNGIGDKPFHVDDNILPPELLQVLGNPFRIRLHLFLIDRCPVSIPTVPSQRRRTCKKRGAFSFGCLGSLKEILCAPPK